ncbi:MAG TPA: hypothetical protein VMR97_04690 [Acidimicrobiales bacterium]|nr:hypothetical protein [Acidimicrobiales bacterium]
MPTLLRAVPEPARSPSRRSARVVAWPDTSIDIQGHDPRSWYVETFWLALLGPTSTWLVRRLVSGFDSAPSGYEIDLDDLARALGVGGVAGRNSPFERAVTRCERFGLARRCGEAELAVRRRLPPLPRRYLVRLPLSLQELHASWCDEQRDRAAPSQMRSRSRRLALSLMEIGNDQEATEVQLHRWHVHPALAHEAAEWALAVRAAAAAPVTPRKPIVNAAFTARP